MFDVNKVDSNIEPRLKQELIESFIEDNRYLAKLGNDGFSLALFRTEVSDSKEFCKKSNVEQRQKILLSCW